MLPTAKSASRRATLPRVLGAIWLPMLLSLPSTSDAEVTTRLTFVRGGFSLVGTMIGLTADLLTIFGGSATGGDNPLYTSGKSAPTLTIVANDVMFDLLL